MFLLRSATKTGLLASLACRSGPLLGQSQQHQGAHGCPAFFPCGVVLGTAGLLAHGQWRDHRAPSHVAECAPKLADLPAAAVATKSQSRILSEGYDGSVDYEAMRSRRKRHREHRLKHDWECKACDLECPDGSTVKWWIPSLKGIINWNLENNSMFQRALTTCMARNPSLPELTLLLYVDEVVPGNVISPDNRRRCHNYFATVQEFELSDLAHESNWLHVASLLSGRANLITGGLSQATKVLLEDAVSDPRGIVAGMKIGLDILKCKFKVIADEKALKEIWGIMGASGIKPCGLFCTNVFAKGHRFASLANNTDICCSDMSFCSPTTDEDLWDAHDELGRLQPTITNTAFEKMETRYGLHYIPCGMLSSLILRQHVKPSSGSRYDSMHCLFSNGTVQFELDQLLPTLRQKVGISNEQLTEYCCAGWRLCGKLINLKFKNDDLKGDASDNITCVPLVEHFLRDVVEKKAYHNMQREIASFCSLSRVVEQLQHIKTRNDCSFDATSELSRLIKLHMDNFKRAYGIGTVKPKHHYTGHLPLQIQRDNKHMDCFAPERKQKTVKRAIEMFDDHTLDRYELFVLDSVCRQMTVQPEPTHSTHGAIVEWGGYLAAVSKSGHTECALQLLSQDKRLHSGASEWRVSVQTKTAPAEYPTCFSDVTLFGTCQSSNLTNFTYSGSAFLLHVRMK